jgi:hypothetical protein
MSFYYIIKLLFFVGIISLSSTESPNRRITYINIVHVPNSLSKNAFFQLKKNILPGQVQFSMNLSSNNLHTAVFSCEDKLNSTRPIRLGPVQSIKHFANELNTNLNKSNGDSSNLTRCLNEMTSMIKDIGLQNNRDNLLFTHVYLVNPFDLKKLRDFKNSLSNLEAVSAVNFTYIGNRQERNFNWFENTFKTINRTIVDFTRIDRTKRVIQSLYNSTIIERHKIQRF